MAEDPNAIIQVLKDALLRKLGDEVDLIFRYGSSIKGTTHAYSDLDISYIPAHESTWVSITVLVGNTLCDLFPMHWSHLERLADFEDVRCTVLLHNQIVYQRSEAVAERFRGLQARLRAHQEPESRLEMLRKALEIFQRTGYSYYLLQQQTAAGHLLACMQHAQQIFAAVLHCLVVCNQACVDTRKMEQVLALPRLPGKFDQTIERLTQANQPADLLAACEDLLDTTRDLLLAEQKQVLVNQKPFEVVFDAAYPELKGDLQHVLLACDRQDRDQRSLLSLYHELMIHMAQALTGVEYSGFNSLPEYEQDLVGLGFPDLLQYVIARDYAGLHRQVQIFDQQLKKYLTEHSVPLNAFTTLEALQKHLS